MRTLVCTLPAGQQPPQQCTRESHDQLYAVSNTDRSRPLGEQDMPTIPQGPLYKCRQCFCRREDVTITPIAFGYIVYILTQYCCVRTQSSYLQLINSTYLESMVAVAKITSGSLQIQGSQFNSDDQDYDRERFQYATSSYQDDERVLKPGLIIKPKNVEDIRNVVKYAKSKGLKIAIRSGGHQYSGASSTGPENIQLNLHDTFRSETDDFKLLEDSEAKTRDVRVSVSWNLGTLIKKLSAVGLFVPTGQCSSVHVGGHLHTGGYGQLARSFGLFGDHVRALEIVDSDGTFTKLDQNNRPDLFAAILGGSPGNFGVVTHATLRVHKSSAYEGSLALKAIHTYDLQKLKTFLTILAKMADDESVPANFDLCISVLSPDAKLKGHLTGLFSRDPSFSQLPKETRDKLFKDDGSNMPRALIIVYAQWVKLASTDTPTAQINDWFATLAKGGVLGTSPGNKDPLHPQTVPMAMSNITPLWIFQGYREFDYPYVKRTYVSNSKTLTADGWAEWMANHFSEITEQDNGLYVSSQLQVYGGKNSRFVTNASDKTSYTWRKDATLGCAIDCFYDTSNFPDARKKANDWETATDTMIGPKGPFAKEQRRLLWGSFGDWEMAKDDVWKKYYDEATYQKIRAARKKYDPQGTFSPNPFCVPAAT